MVLFSNSSQFCWGDRKVNKFDNRDKKHNNTKERGDHICSPKGKLVEKNQKKNQNYSNWV